MNSLRDNRTDAEKSPLERILTRVVRVQWWLLLGLGVAGGLFYYNQPIEQPDQLRALISEVSARKADLSGKKDQLLQRIDWLKTEPDYLEVRALDALNRKKNGQQMVRFQ